VVASADHTKREYDPGSAVGRLRHEPQPPGPRGCGQRRLRQPGARATIDASASVKTSTERLFAISRDSDHGFMWLGSDMMPKKN
jgi:hypothetical protein